MNTRPLRLISLLFLVAGLTACGESEPPWRGHDITGVMPELDYNLVDENSEPVSAGAYADNIRLLFFGFTHCPDICPVTLGRLKAAIATLEPAQRERIRVLFVSVDPERDPPAVLRRYTDNFGERFIGLTGSQAQLRELTKRYRVTYGYGEKDKNGFYPVSHSSAVFVFDPQGNARLLFNQSLTVTDIAADLERLIDAGATVETRAKGRKAVAQAATGAGTANYP